MWIELGCGVAELSETALKVLDGNGGREGGGRSPLHWLFPLIASFVEFDPEIDCVSEKVVDIGELLSSVPAADAAAAAAC